MRYWDSSALVPVVIAEAQSPEVKQLLGDDTGVVTWWASDVECASAIARQERSHSGDGDFDAAYTALAGFARTWLVVAPAATTKELAVRMLRVHSLRAADALQLAAAVIAAQHRPAELDFVCLDVRLRVAAEKEGFAVLPA